MAPYSFSDSLKNLLSPFSSLGKKPAGQTTPSSLFTLPKPTNPFNYQSAVNAVVPPKVTPVSPSPTPVVPQVKTPVATVKPQLAPKAPIAPVVPQSGPTTYQTPSGATVDANGQLIAPPQAPQSPAGSTQDAQGSTPTPPVPTITPESQKALDSANKAYEESLKITPEELSTQEDIDRLIESTKKSFVNTSGQAIPLEFITGQLKSIEDRANALAEPLERKMSRLQAARTSSLEASKFALDRAEKKVQAERDASKPISGSSFYDPKTGKFIQAPVAEKAKEGFTLSPGEKRYDAEGKLVASGGEKPLSDAAQVKADEKADAKKAGTSSALDNYSLVNELLKNPALSQISGLQNVFTVFTPGTQAQTAKNIYSQVKSILSLENRKQLKGSGAISDFEAQTLEKASSSLGRNLSDAEFQKQLKKIRGAFATSAGLEADVKVTAPNGEVISSKASRAEIDQLISEGNTVEYQ